MKIFYQFLIVLLFSTQLYSQTFDEFIKSVKSSDIIQKEEIINKYFQSIHTYPIIVNQSIVHFIYIGEAKSVKIAGDATGWQPKINLENVPDTNLWFKTIKYEKDARLDYKFVVNDKNWILDPKNPNTMKGGFGPNSELRMPEYESPEELVVNREIGRGSVVVIELTSKYLNNKRKIMVYLPSEYNNSDHKYPVMLFHDGPDYLNLGNAATVIDNLIEKKEITPFIGVFVPSVNRNSEYSGKEIDKFTSFIMKEVMPWAEENYRILDGANNHAVMGASNGGNISLSIAMNNTDYFGKVAAQSSNVMRSITTTFSNSKKLPLDIYLDLGTYDIPALIPLVRNLKKILDTKGYDFEYAEYHEGHSWGLWKAHLDDVFIRFFPYRPNTRR